MPPGGRCPIKERLDDTIRCFMDLAEAAKHYPGLKKQWIEFKQRAADPVIARVETNDAEAA